MPALGQLVAQFISVMQEEKAIYEELLSLSEKKTDAALSKSVNEMDAIVRGEQGMILRLGQCEKRRMLYLDSFCKETGSAPETVTMLSLVAHAGPEQSRRLRDLHDDLEGILKKLSEKNKMNKALLESRLDYVHFAMDMLTAGQDSGVYSIGGCNTGYNAGQEAGGKTILDRKV